MTVSTTAVSVSYAGDGGTTAFPITFQFGTSADLSVALIDATGAETAQTLTTHYTVSQSASGTGTLTMLTAPASGYTLRIRRITAKVQPDSLRNKGQYYPETVEQMFDRNTRQIQEAWEATERALHVPFGSTMDGELPAPVAGAVPMVNDSESGFSWALWGTNPEALASLAMGGGAALVGFKQSGTGAVARTMQDKARDHVSILDFIPVAEHAAIRAGTSTYDCAPALTKAIESAGVNDSIFYTGGPRILFPLGRYYFASTIQIKRTVILEGCGSGLAGGAATKLEFAADTGGIIVQRYNTIDDTIESPTTRGGDASIIRGMLLSGAGTAGHGIWLRSRAKLHDICIDGFGENGLNIHASAGGGGAAEGNANNWVANTIRITNCGGHGMYVDGADVNSGIAIGIDATSNGLYGIYDSSFLGNTYIACHTAGNGVATAGNNPSGSSSFVHFGGMRYAANPGATEADYVATQPGTNANVWVPIIAGAEHPTIPTWVAAQPEGTYFAGGAYRTDGLNATNAFIGCYSESGQGASDFVGITTVLGGSIYGAGFTRGGYIRGDSGNILTAKNGGGFSVDGTLIDASFGAEDSVGTVLKFQHSGDSAANIWRLHRSGNDWVLDNSNSGARVAMTFTGEHTNLQMGTSVPMPYKAVFSQLAVGSGVNIRRQTTGSSAPTSAEWGRGDIVWSIVAAAAGKAGWICTTAGTAGSTAVFKPFGAIDA